MVSGSGIHNKDGYSPFLSVLNIIIEKSPGGTMKVIEQLKVGNKPNFSFEIIPPQRGKSAQEILSIVENLKSYQPRFIDVTSHSSEVKYEESNDGMIRRRVRKKRPGTMSICGIIQNRFNIDTVAHLLCRGFTREETEDALIELNYLGIQTVLAIQGDEQNYKKTIESHRSANVFASDLVKQIVDLRRGEYIEELDGADPIDMCIGVAGYPEKHFEAPNLNTDITHLKQKVEAGADYIVCQMFFDNQVFYEFKEKCRAEGITVPIIPGIKIIDRIKQLKTIPKNFHVNIPDELVQQMLLDRKRVKEIGINWCLMQCMDLLEHGENHIHFYVMNDVSRVTSVMDQILKKG